MSTIEHTASGTIGKIPLGRRISELMQERGDAFSIRAFSQRIGMNRETFRTILTGERSIMLTELAKITSGLHVSEERLRQMDTFKKEEELESLLKGSGRTRELMLHALKIAMELVDVAQGMTERGISLANIGRVYFHLQQYDEAHDAWLASMEFAEKINSDYEDSSLLYHVTSFLLISFTLRREYTNIQHTLNVVESAFSTDPEKMGYANYARMKWHEHRGNLLKAKEYAYRALDYFQQTGDQEQIGKAMINVGHFEYHTGNYAESASILSSALEVLQMYEYSRLFAIKDYVKTLLKMKDKSTAIQLIKGNSNLFDVYPDLYGKLQILYTFADENPAHADVVIRDTRVSDSIRYSACKCLMEHYTAKRDSDSVMRYYEESIMFSQNRNSFIDEEGF